MLIRVEMQWVLAATLISIRLAALLWAVPLFTLGPVPIRIRVIFVLVLSAGLATVLVPASVPTITTMSAWVGAALTELMVGLLMAFGLHCAFAALSFGGRLLDLQMGFGVAQLIDPSSGDENPLLGTLLLVVGVMTFFLLDGHHWVARGFVQSYEWMPLGGSLSQLSPEPLVAQFGLMFSLGTMLVAPVVVVLLLIDVGLAMAAKSMPQMNVFMISIPVKIVVGLLVLAASAPYMRGVLQKIYESIFIYWRALGQ